MITSLDFCHACLLLKQNITYMFFNGYVSDVPEEFQDGQHESYRYAHAKNQEDTSDIG